MSHSKLLLTWLFLVTGLRASGFLRRAAAASLVVVAAATAATAQELPLRFAGDGATVIITELDEAAGKVAGTIQTPGESALPFTLDLSVRPDGLQVGKGKVQTPTIARRISTRENEDGSVKITYRAKRYVVSLVGSGPVPQPGPQPVTGGQDPAVNRAASPSATANVLGTIRLKKHTFKDRQFRNQPSHTMLVPVGWEVEGGAYWAPPVYYQNMPSQEIQITSPEGHMLRIEPSMIAKDFTPPPQYGMQRPQEGQSDKGFPIIYMPQGLPAWKSWMQGKILPAIYPKARNLRVNEAVIIPELTAIMAKQYEPLRAMLQSNAQLDAQMGSRTSFDTWVLGFEISYELDGQPFEELRMIAVMAQTMESQMMGRQIMWSTDRSFAFRAPKGELVASMPLFSTLANSLQGTQPWLINKAELFAKIMKSSREAALANLRASQQRSAILSQTYSDISDITHNGYRNRTASSDRMQVSAVQAIREVDIYSVPGSGTAVELPSGYNHVYANGNDEYLLTNDSLFNPNVDLNVGNWTPMETPGR